MTGESMRRVQDIRKFLVLLAEDDKFNGGAANGGCMYYIRGHWSFWRHDSIATTGNTVGMSELTW